MALRLLVTATALLLAAGAVRIAVAEDAGEPIRLAYHAGPGCPDEASFVARVRARSARARLVGEGEKARTFTVELSSGAHPSGSVIVSDGAGSEGARRLEADTCDEAANVIALMVALALDPHASPAATPAPTPTPTQPSDGAPTAVTPPPTPASAASRSAPASLDAGAPDAAPDAARDSAADASSDAAPDAAPPSSPAAAPPPPPAPGTHYSYFSSASLASFHFFGGADVVVATGVFPSVLYAGAPYLGWRSTRPALVGASIRASFLRERSDTVAAPGGSALFTWTLGRLDGCAMLWPHRPLRLGACARVEAGILDAAGQGIVGATTQHSAWFALDPLARLEWSFLGPLMVEASAGPSFRITADQFFFYPGSNVYEVPYVGFLAEAGLGVHFL